LKSIPTPYQDNPLARSLDQSLFFSTSLFKSSWNPSNSPLTCMRIGDQAMNIIAAYPCHEATCLNRVLPDSSPSQEAGSGEK
jgi:hypothetical protein